MMAKMESDESETKGNRAGGNTVRGARCCAIVLQLALHKPQGGSQITIGSVTTGVLWGVLSRLVLPSPDFSLWLHRGWGRGNLGTAKLRRDGVPLKSSWVTLLHF
jgi:hypothetical protein